MMRKSTGWIRMTPNRLRSRRSRSVSFQSMAFTLRREITVSHLELLDVAIHGHEEKHEEGAQHEKLLPEVRQPGARQVDPTDHPEVVGQRDDLHEPAGPHGPRVDGEDEAREGELGDDDQHGYLNGAVRRLRDGRDEEPPAEVREKVERCHREQ